MSFLDKEKLVKLWNSRENMKEVLFDRGFPLESSIPFHEFKEWANQFSTEEEIKEGMEMIREKGDKTSEKILVCWSLKFKLGTNIRDIKRKMDEEEISKAIVICDDSVTTNSKKIIGDLKQSKIYIDVYVLDEAQFNITKHRLVPKHEICSVKEKRRIMSSYSLLPSQIPKISFNDPMARHLRATKGQLIKITRPSETQIGKEVITYRIVK